jgi:hypothetical protein
MLKRTREGTRESRLLIQEQVEFWLCIGVGQGPIDYVDRPFALLDGPAGRR